MEGGRDTESTWDYLNIEEERVLREDIRRAKNSIGRWGRVKWK